MNNEELLNKLKITEEDNKRLQDELIKTKEHLKKYTAPSRSKQFYENHKEEIIQKVKNYKKTTNYIVPPEVIKERNKKAYLKRKDKLKELENQNENI
jgi:hypothetical protein